MLLKILWGVSAALKRFLVFNEMMYRCPSKKEKSMETLVVKVLFFRMRMSYLNLKFIYFVSKYYYGISPRGMKSEFVIRVRPRSR